MSIVGPVPDHRDQYIAHLSLHGWEPVFNGGSGRAGIYNEQLGVGFSVRDDAGRSPLLADSSVKRIDREHRMQSYERCEWDRVTPWHLQRIDNRLRQV